MWIFSRPRNEHENRFLLNLDQSSRINLIQLGERWFVEVMLGTESVPVAAANSPEEAAALIKQIFDSLLAGADALDLDASAQQPGNEPRPGNESRLGTEQHNGRGDGRAPAPPPSERTTSGEYAKPS